MNKTRIAALVLGVGMIAAPAALFAQGPPPPQGYGYGQGPGGPGGPGGWDAPPREFTRDIQRQGFRDGMYGAQKDFENHRRPTVMNRDEYRNYRGPERRFYQAAFQRGYNAWWNHQGPRRPY
jgi:hypothetical protein